MTKSRLALWVCALNALLASACSDPGETPMPKVVSTTPAANATDVPVNLSEIVIQFDRAIDTALATPDSIHVTTGDLAVACTTTLSADALKLSAACTSPLLGNAPYHVVLAAGIAGQAEFEFDFKTAAAPDRDPPRWLDRTPSDGATDVAPTASIQVTWSEAVAPASINADTFRVADLTSSSPVAGVLSCATLSCAFVATRGFTPSHLYQVTLSDGIQDLAGNALANPGHWSFTARGRSWTELARRTRDWSIPELFSMNRRGDAIEVRRDSDLGSISVITTSATSDELSAPLQLSLGVPGSVMLLDSLYSDRGTQIIIAGALVTTSSPRSSTVTLLAFVRASGADAFAAPQILGQLTGSSVPAPSIKTAEGSDGRIYVAWRGDPTSLNNSLMASVRDPQGVWSDLAERLTTGPIASTTPILEAGPTGEVHLAATVFVATGTMRFISRTYHPGSGWGPELTLFEGLAASDLRLAASPEGDLFAAYTLHQGTTGADTDELRVARLAPAATSWDASKRVGTTATPSATIKQLVALPGGRVSLFFNSTATSVTSPGVGQMTWATGAGSALIYSSSYLSDFSCLDDEGRVAILRAQTSATSDQITHYRNLSAGAGLDLSSFFVASINLADGTDVTGSKLACARSGRMRLFVSSYTPGDATASQRTWDYR